MKCKIENIANGPFFSYGITESKERIKVLHGHLFYDKVIEVDRYDDNFYIAKKMNYNDESILSKHIDEEGLIDLNLLREDPDVSKPYNRIYEIDGFWFFVPKILNSIVEYLYSSDLLTGSKIRLTKLDTTVTAGAPMINVNYNRLFHILTEKKKSVTAHFYCEKTKDSSNGVYADFFVLGNLSKDELQFELWEIIDDGSVLFYSHFIQNINANTFKHFDLATHLVNPNSRIEDLLKNKIKPDIIEKKKWFRNDNNFTKDQVLEITKLFFPLDVLIDEFYTKNYD